jgi:hypothetical protein
LKLAIFVPEERLTAPDVEELVHAMFEVAHGREPMPRNRDEFSLLINKYAGAYA